MIEDIVISIIFGVVIGFLFFIIKRYRDVKSSIKRIKKNNAGGFAIDGKKITVKEEVKGGEEKNGNNRKTPRLPKPKEGAKNPSNAKQ